MAHPKPSIALPEQRIMVMRMGINKGKPRMATNVALLFALETNPDTKVSTVEMAATPSINEQKNMGLS